MKEEVLEIQAFLKKAGYLNDDYLPGRLDGPTLNALLDFRRKYEMLFIGYELTEICGDAEFDRTYVLLEIFSRFTQTPKIQDNSYFGRKRSMTYGFVDFPFPQVDGFRSAIRDAFDTWQECIHMEFNESADPDISLIFHGREIQDNCHFGDPGNHLALAQYPPPIASTSQKVSIHFDSQDNWDVASGGFDFEAVAVHEIGHVLGLRDSDVRTDLMYHGYDPKKKTLGENDLLRIAGLYGRRGPDLEIAIFDDQGVSYQGIAGELIKCAGRITAFSIRIKQPGVNLRLEYCAIVDDVSSNWVPQATTLGNPGVSAIQGFAVRLLDRGKPYRFGYLALRPGIDSQLYYEGRMCGRQGLAPMSGMLVQMESV